MHIGSLGEFLQQLPFGRSDQHVVHEQRMIGSCAEGSDFESGILIPSNVTVDYDASHLVVDVIDGELFDDFERLTL